MKTKMDHLDRSGSTIDHSDWIYSFDMTQHAHCKLERRDINQWIVLAAITGADFLSLARRGLFSKPGGFWQFRSLFWQYEDGILETSKEVDYEPNP